jgi:RNA polymerase sigma-70 factor, ECF subfamily
LKTKEDDIEISWIEASKRDKRHFAPLYERYYEMIFRFVFKRVQDMDVTGDLVSGVFMKAMVNINQYTHQGYPFSSWLFRIALNETNMWFRAQKKRVEVPLSQETAASLLDEFQETRNDADLERMVEAMNELKEEQVLLIELRFFENHSFQEIGNIFDVAENTAKMRVYRALEALRNSMERGK